MLKIENIEIAGYEATILGMRNSINSWNKTDSKFNRDPDYGCSGSCPCTDFGKCSECYIGPNDISLMKTLCKSVAGQRKFMKTIVVYADITAPLYWWKEFDTYKVGTVANSCSTMHKIAAKEFTLDDFSHEHIHDSHITQLMLNIIDSLNEHRKYYNCETDPIIKKEHWWQMIQLLPSSYNQQRIVMLNYEVLSDIYNSRKYDKLDEWCEHHESTCTVDAVGKCLNQKEWLLCEDCSAGKGFCDWIKTLPYSELITGDYKEEDKNGDSDERGLL